MLVCVFPGRANPENGISADNIQFYFKNEDRQLEVIRLRGAQAGPTALIFGGIHGDEPGGHFSGEILSRVNMIKGNLIIVPRVNFPSIMLNRRELNGDMNRKFTAQSNPGDPDSEVLGVLKALMKEADIFINQHDAFGFHREKYINKLYNPSRYGQSLIVDCAEFYSRKLKKTIPLGLIGQRIMARVNARIENKEYHFGFWDHNSVHQDTLHPEMRSSATYYALTEHSLASFGLETSKDLPTLSHKVKYQLLVIQEILTEFGLEFSDFPDPDVKMPELYWLELIKNDTEVLRVNGNTNLRLNAGDRIVIRDIRCNYGSGLSANIADWGTLNDTDKEYVFEKDAAITVKKNHMNIGEIWLRQYLPSSVRHINLEVDGRRVTISNWGKVEVGRKGVLKIIGTEPEFPGTEFDIRGYTALPGFFGDAGQPVAVSRLLPSYSLNGRGEIYFVKIFIGKVFAGGFQVQALPTATSSR